MFSNKNTWSVKLDSRCKPAIERIRHEFAGISTHAEAVAVAIAFTYQAVTDGGIRHLPIPDDVLPANEDLLDD
jgi:hypothetical protein